MVGRSAAKLRRSKETFVSNTGQRLESAMVSPYAVAVYSRGHLRDDDVSSDQTFQFSTPSVYMFNDGYPVAEVEKFIIRLDVSAIRGT